MLPIAVTFDEVCAFLRKDAPQDPKLLSAVDRVLGLTLICLQSTVSPAVALLLPSLEVKGELMQLGRWMFETLTRKSEKEYNARLRRIHVAHCLLVYTSFFEALDGQLPDHLRKRFQVLRKKEFADWKSLFKKREDPALAEKPAPETTVFERMDVPEPTTPFAEQLERHEKLWSQLASGLGDKMKAVLYGDPNSTENRKRAKEREVEENRQNVDRIMNAAAKATKSIFVEQALELAFRFPDFATWSNLQEHRQTREFVDRAVTSAASDLKNYFSQWDSLRDSHARVDVGLRRLNDAVLCLPTILRTERASHVLEDLAKRYRTDLDSPLAPDDNFRLDNRPFLTFPTARQSYIPQLFKTHWHSDPHTKLGDDATWADKQVHRNLGEFLLTQLTSPYSSQYPILILGEPGIGKSLLTKVLAGQMMSDYLTVVRVPLRDVDAEAEIARQVAAAINAATNGSNVSWHDLSSSLKVTPILLILDGYDELLQASGKLLSSYLLKVQSFQHTEFSLDRPIRVLVTSRVTLIDKATVPVGSLILRLLPFDSFQRELWISGWNNVNRAFFASSATQPFELPDQKDGEVESRILALAEQPLLLAMLALYDSQGNQLRENLALDRTELYDHLLRRFIARQRNKEEWFRDASESDRESLVKADMHRLGVAAFGMLNRGKSWISDEELEDDLRFYRLDSHADGDSSTPNSAPPLRRTTGMGRLSVAESVLGGFFFIHKASAQISAGSTLTQRAAAYEFLHLTFAEFLAADFMLGVVLHEIEVQVASTQNHALKRRFERLSESADPLDSAWYAILVHTPFFTRPVVLQMMREWTSHVLLRRQMESDVARESMDKILLRQLLRILGRPELPSDLLKSVQLYGSADNYSLLGHLAVYSLNLVLVRAVLFEKPYLFDESVFDVPTGTARPWDRLTHLWRSWLSIDALREIAAVLEPIFRQGSHVTVRARSAFSSPKGDDALKTRFNIGSMLGDDTLAGLSGLLLWKPRSLPSEELDEIERRLKSEGINLDLQIDLRRLQEAEESSAETGRGAREYESVLRLAMATSDIQVVEQMSTLLRRRTARGQTLDRHMEETSISTRPDLTRTAVAFSLTHPRCAMSVLEIVTALRGSGGASAFVQAFTRTALQDSRDRTNAGSLGDELREAAQEMLHKEGVDQLPRYADPSGAAAVLNSALNITEIRAIAERAPGSAATALILANSLFQVAIYKHVFRSQRKIDIAFADLKFMIEEQPTLALQWFRVAEDLSDHELSQYLPEECCVLAFSEGFLDRLAAKNRELPHVLLDYAIERAESLRTRISTASIAKVFAPKALIAANSRRTLTALSKFAPYAASRINSESYDWLSANDCSTESLKSLLRLQPRAFEVLFEFAQHLRGAARASLAARIVPALLEGHTISPDVFRLSLSALSDLSWLARATRSPELGNLLGRFRATLS